MVDGPGQDVDRNMAEGVRKIATPGSKMGVQFQNVDGMSDKQYRKYISTPSPKRMRNVQKALQSLSFADLNASISSIPTKDCFLNPYVVPRPRLASRDAPISSVLYREGEGKQMKPRSLTLSFSSCGAEEGAVKRFLDKRNSTEGDYAMSRLCVTGGDGPGPGPVPPSPTIIITTSPSTFSTSI